MSATQLCAVNTVKLHNFARFLEKIHGNNSMQREANFNTIYNIILDMQK